MGRFISEDPLGFGGGTNFYEYVGNDPIQWADAYGLKKCKSCGLKRPPAYDVAGTVPGGTTFHWHAEFLNDDTHDPKCCEVRQLVSWNNGPPNHAGFQPPGKYKPGVLYEDRDGAGTRYGRRTGPYVDRKPDGSWPDYNSYHGNEYDGKDQPSIHHKDIFHFRLIVVDVCNGGKTIYTGKTINVTFP